jgi:hypothetical protein
MTLDAVMIIILWRVIEAMAILVGILTFFTVAGIVAFVALALIVDACTWGVTRIARWCKKYRPHQE